MRLIHSDSDTVNPFNCRSAHYLPSTIIVLFVSLSSLHDAISSRSLSPSPPCSLSPNFSLPILLISSPLTFSLSISPSFHPDVSISLPPCTLSLSQFISSLSLSLSPALPSSPSLSQSFPCFKLFSLALSFSLSLSLSLSLSPFLSLSLSLSPPLSLLPMSHH